MIEFREIPAIGTVSEIRIIGINREKTRKPAGPDSRYGVYFELSEAPGQPWRAIFEQEWKTLTPDQPTVWQEASFDGKFLVIRCALDEVANTYLPLLKEAVTATNVSYPKHVQTQLAEKERRVNVWKRERKSVDEMADSLRFD